MVSSLAHLLNGLVSFGNGGGPESSELLFIFRFFGSQQYRNYSADMNLSKHVLMVQLSNSSHVRYVACRVTDVWQKCICVKANNVLFFIALPQFELDWLKTICTCYIFNWCLTMWTCAMSKILSNTISFTCMSIGEMFLHFSDSLFFTCLHCFDAVGWAAGRASGL